MKETKFTPKPWRRDDREWGDKWQIRGMANGAKTHDVPHKCDAVICSVNNNLLEADANAALLTAAPEMYSDEEDKLVHLRTLRNQILSLTGLVPPNPLITSNFVLKYIDAIIQDTEQLLAKARGEAKQ